MANRAYLYSVNDIPGRNKDTDLIVKGLSEYSNNIPLAYLILMSANTTRCPSLIWGKSNVQALAADYQTGVGYLREFIDLMLQSDIKDKEVFRNRARETLEFLENPANVQKFFLLELSEVYLFHMQEKDLKKVEEDAADVLKSLHVKNVRFLSLTMGEDITRGWEEVSGIDGTDGWFDALYYDFSSPVSQKK